MSNEDTTVDSAIFFLLCYFEKISQVLTKEIKGNSLDVVVGLVYLINGISTTVGYLMPKSFS